MGISGVDAAALDELERLRHCPAPKPAVLDAAAKHHPAKGEGEIEVRVGAPPVEGAANVL